MGKKDNDIQKESFVLYFSDGKLFKRLSLEEAGQLINAIFEYAKTGRLEDTGNGAIDMALTCISDHLDRDKKTYLERCKKAQKAAGKRWEERQGNNTNGSKEKPTDANGCKDMRTDADGCGRMRTDANNADTDTDTDTDTESDTDTDTDSESDTVFDSNNKRGRKKPRAPAEKFIKPSLEDIKAYCVEMGYTGIDAQQIYDYYESNGWKVGRNPMKNWKAAVRTWMSRQKDFVKRPATGSPKQNRFNQFEQHVYDFEQLEGLLTGQ